MVKKRSLTGLHSHAVGVVQNKHDGSGTKKCLRLPERKKRICQGKAKQSDGKATSQKQ